MLIIVVGIICFIYILIT